MRNAKILTFAALTAAATGFFCGRTLPSSASMPSRHLSSLPSRNDINQLPCPTEEQFQELLKRVHMEDTLEGKSTCDSSRRGVLAKVLFLLSSLKTTPPEGWGGSANEMIRDPFGYVSRVLPKLGVDLSQTNSVAYNSAQVEVFLGGMFFTSEPLYALMVLVHESRHSEPLDPAHQRCRVGDIPKTEGGCDRLFSLSADAGAYSYSVLFFLGLAQFHESLSPEDKEFLRSSALLLLGNRFNEVPPFLATPHDLILALDEQGRSSLVNPFVPELEPLELPVAERVDHNPRNAGAFFFLKNGQLYTWSRITPYERFNADIIPADLRFKDSNKFYVSGDSYAVTAFLRENGELDYIENGDPSGISMLKKFRVQPLDAGFTPKRIFTADMFSAFSLAEEGKLYILSMSARGGGSGNQFKLHRTLQEKSFTQATGGVVYDGIFGVSEGRLYREGTKKGKAGFHPVLTDFQGQGELVKYFEATNFRTLLNREGKLFLRRFDSGLESSLSLPLAVKDFTILRHYSLNSSVALPDPGALADFLRECQARDAMIEPWLGRPIGLGRNGYLVTRVGNEPCRELKELGRPTAFQFDASPANKQNNYFPQVGLEMRYEGGTRRHVYPYEFSGK